MHILVIDDEDLARERIVSFLKDLEDIKAIDECSNGRDAIKKIVTEKPDLIFLDVQMPEVTGFDVLNKIKSVYLPLIIFVTAFDEFAVKAFEFHAVDYLLKPFDRKRFNSALNHARLILNASNTNNANEQIISLLNSIKHPKKNGENYPHKFIIRETGKISFIDINEIEYLEAAGNYIKIKTSTASYLMRETMNNIENKLDPKLFLRIHRSYIVKIDQIKEFKTYFDGEYIAVLKNKSELKTGKVYRNKIHNLFSSL
jgi:two-component system LytT family response regulator